MFYVIKIAYLSTSIKTYEEYLYKSYIWLWWAIDNGILYQTCSWL